MFKKVRQIVNNINLKSFRFWVQLSFFLLLIYGGYFAINLGSSFPVFACPFNDESAAVCYLISLQHQLAIPTQVIFSMASLSVLIGFLTFLVWFIVLNKAWCGYVCPIGTLQDWISSLRKYLNIGFSSYSQTEFNTLSKIKYIFLAIVILIPLFKGMNLLGSDWSHAFCQMCPARVITPMFSGDFSQIKIDYSSNTLVILTTLGIVFTVMFFVGSFFKKRFFCFFCPMSALHYIFSKFSILKFVKEGDKCTKCGACYAVCDMQIKDIADDISSKNILRDDCILCLKCIAACPEEEALHLDIINFSIFTSTKEGFEKRMGYKNESK